MSNDQPIVCNSNQGLQQQVGLRVVCLCAAWCGVCREYAPEFDRLVEKFSQVRFIWLDVEANEDVIGDVDVETFPTLLIGMNDRPLFFGPLLPQIKVLERLIESLVRDPCAHTSLSKEIAALWQRLSVQ